MDELLAYRAELLDRLARQPSELRAAAALMSEAEWGARRVTDGSTLHQVVAHVRDVEVLAFLQRIRRILAEDRPTLEFYATHNWSADRYRPAEPLADILAEFARAREAGLQLMRGMAPDDWARIGFHPPSGWRTAQWWAERMYAHSQEHLAEIRRAHPQALSGPGVPDP